MFCIIAFLQSSLYSFELIIVSILFNICLKLFDMHVRIVLTNNNSFNIKINYLKHYYPSIFVGKIYSI